MKRWTYDHKPEEIGWLVKFDGVPMFYRQWFGEGHTAREIERLNETHPNGLDD